MTYRFRPSLRSFLASLAFAAIPAVIAVAVHHWLGSRMRVLVWIGSAVLVLMSFLYFVQAMSVHLIRLEISPEGIRRFGGPSGEHAMRWSEITEATLRERRNPVSRTDRLLILKSRDKMLNYPLSILSRADELKALEELNRRTKLLVIQDDPAV